MLRGDKECELLLNIWPVLPMISDDNKSVETRKAACKVVSKG